MTVDNSFTMKKFQSMEIIYVTFSQITKLPYVECDPETFDDQVYMFTEEEAAKEFAKSYAQELEYEIDEMGVLALYNRISSIEKLDEATTLFEVKDIVDEAVAKSEKGGFKKAFSVFASKRHGQGDRKVLQEKDFEE